MSFSPEGGEMPSLVGSKFNQALSGYVLHGTGGEAGLFEGTVVALQSGEPYASNYEILSALHREYQRWASTLPSNTTWTTQHLARSLRRSNVDGVMGRYEEVRHGYVAHLLPVGIHFREDPGRAFEIAVAAANLVEFDGQICLGSGALAMLVAHLAKGTPLDSAVYDVTEFLMCLDWGDDLTGVLRYALKTKDIDDVDPHHAPRALEMVFHAVRTSLRATSVASALEECVKAARPREEMRIVGVLTSLSLGLERCAP